MGSWGTTGGTTSSTTTLSIGNSYDETKGSGVVTSYGTAVYATDVDGLSYKCSLTGVAGYCVCTSKKTAYDTVATFAVSPSIISSATITITHASADSFPAYIAVASSASATNTFIQDLSSCTSQSITLNGTSTTITLSSSILTKLKNLGGTSIVLNLGKYYPSGAVKSSYSNTLGITAVSMSCTVSNVTLSYNANGGSGAPSSATVTPDTSYTLSTTIPTRTGYTFLGWGKSNSATTATYTAGGTITISADTILYAVWSANTYTITYDANGGSTTSSATTSQSVVYGTTWTTNSGAGFSKTGYTLSGWATTTSGSASYSLGAAQSTYTTASNTTLYAAWTILTYEVSYKPDSYCTNTTTYSATKAYGQSLTLRAATYTRPGYTQTGWTTTQNGAKVYDLSGAYTDNAALTLYPVWTENATHTVSLNPNGGSLTSNTEFTVHEGGYYGENFESYELPTPTHTSTAKSFQGWYNESGLKVKGTDIYNYTKDTTLTARWNAIPVVIIEVKNGTTRLVTGRNGSHALTM